MNNCKIKLENNIIHSSIKKHKIPINLRKMSKTSIVKTTFLLLDKILKP